MEKIINKIELELEKWFKNLEEKPLKTGIKICIIYWIIKKIYNLIKD